MKWFGKRKKKRIVLCPSCKKPTLKPATNVSGWLDATLYRCTNPSCNYVGRFYIEVDIDEIKSQQDDGVKNNSSEKDNEKEVRDES
ncbi:MAG: hypothetical protein ACTSVI_04705 [Promethearchaeota archaeon]